MDTEHLMGDAMLDSEIEESRQNAELNVMLTEAAITDALNARQKEAKVPNHTLMFSYASIVEFFASDACDFTETAMLDLRTNDGPMRLSFFDFKPKKKYAPPFDYY